MRLRAVRGALNWRVDRLVYRPLRNAPKLAPLVSAIGVSFIFMNIGLFWGGLPMDVFGGGTAAAAPKAFPTCCRTTTCSATTRRCASPPRTWSWSLSSLPVMVGAVPVRQLHQARQGDAGDRAEPDRGAADGHRRRPRDRLRRS